MPGAAAAGACSGGAGPGPRRAAELFGLSEAEAALLNEIPYRGQGTPVPPADPLIYASMRW